MSTTFYKTAPMATSMFGGEDTPGVIELTADEAAGFTVQALPDTEPGFDPAVDARRTLTDTVGELRGEFANAAIDADIKPGAAFAYAEAVIAARIAEEPDEQVRKELLVDAADGMAAFSRRYDSPAKAKRALRPLVYGPDRVRAAAVAHRDSFLR